MIAYFARHPTAANLLMAAFLAVGLLRLPQLRRETFPDITPGEVQVQIAYPGATAKEVEEAVCQRVEDAVDGVKFVKEVRSDARENVASVVVEMQEGGDFQTFLVDVQAEIDAIDDFPEDVEEPIVAQVGATDPVLSLIVSGPMQPPDLKAYCEQFKKSLQRLPDVSLVTVEGFSDHQLRIELSAPALMRYGLSAADVAGIVERQSVNLPAGVLETRDQDLLIRFVEERRDPDELADLIIVAGQGGAEVRLGDIAEIRDLFEDAEEMVLLDGRRAGKLVVEKTKNQDVIRVSNAIKAFVAAQRQRHPLVDIRVTEDSSTLVVDRLEMLLRNAWQGIILVFLVLWLFFNFRLSFWVVMSLPTSFLAAFFLMPLLGLTVNMLTMVSMLLALGLLMDDGIVIAENIASHLARGKSAMQAAIDGVSEVKAGVFSSFLTTVCVLGPLATLKGDIGKVLKVVPMLLILVLAISLVEAFFILPAHLGHALAQRREQAPRRFRGWFEGRIEALRLRVVGPAVDWALRWRYFTLATLVGLFLGSISMLAGGVLKFIAFPDLDGDVVVARLLMPPGTPLERTAASVEQITDALDRVNRRFAPRQPRGADLVQTVVVEFSQNLDALETGPHVATVTADLLNAETRDAPVSELIDVWREETGPLVDVLDLIYTEPALGPAGRPIELRMSGDDLAALDQAAAEVQQWLSHFVGVYNLTDDLRTGKPELRVELREGALGLGLDGAAVARQLRSAFQGTIADEIQVDAEDYEIDVQLRPADQNAETDLEAFYFTGQGGAQIPLASVAEITREVGWSRIARIDGVRTVTVRGEVDVLRANTADILRELKGSFLPALAERYPDVSFNFEGEAKEAETTQQSMLRNMLLGLLGVFILLSFQFKSYLEPLTVMMVIPLALIGVVWGHLLMGVDVSMPSMLGFASLAGIVVNDSILLVLFLKAARDEGREVLAACGEASRQRFRAILLTSLTTIAGLLPLLAERSLQAQVLIPLAISIAFGLAISTVLVLVAVPCLYAVFYDLGWTRSA